jgi:hypothetical protein
MYNAVGGPKTTKFPLNLAPAWETLVEPSDTLAHI